MQLEEILNRVGMPKSLNRLVMTCVDPNYPVSSMGLDFEDIDVSYDEHHIQKAGEGYEQLFLAYDGNGGWDKITKDKVHDSLGLGVVQLAWNKEKGVVVLGTPGDSYTCHPKGRGFGFGTTAAPPQAMHDMITTLLTYGQNTGKSQFGEVAIMLHPDCGAFAAGPGMNAPDIMAYASALSTSPDKFMGSHYEIAELENKKIGFSAISTLGYDLGVPWIRKIEPAYVGNRLPGPHRLHAH